MNFSGLLFSLAELGNYLLSNLHIVFFILAGLCLVGFFVTFIIYLNINRSKEKPQQKNWTIESAKRYLESNNISIKENSNKDVEKENVSEVKTTKAPRAATTSLSKKPVKPLTASKIQTSSVTPKKPQIKAETKVEEKSSETDNNV